MLGGLAAILFGMAVHAPFIVGAESLFPDQVSLFKAWKELLMVFLAVPVVAMMTRRRLWRAFISAWPVRIALMYIGLHLLLAITIRGEGLAVIAGLMIDLRFIAFFLLCYAAAMMFHESSRINLRAATIAAGIVIGFGLLQITVFPDNVLSGIGYDKQTIRPFTTIDSNTDYVRINSTTRGPNPLGALAMLYAVMALSYITVRRRFEKRWWIGVAAAVSSVAVLFASYSRSAYLALFGAIAVLSLIRLRQSLTSKRIAIGIVGVAIAAIGLFQLRTTDWYANVVLHEDPESTVVDKSNDGHVESLIDGAQRAVRQPFGAGVGSTGSAVLYGEDTSGPTIENAYLFIAHESGWLGLGLFVALQVIVLRQLYKKRSSWAAIGLFAGGIGLIVIGMLLPVWADESVALTWWGLAGGILGGGYATKRPRQ
jgi:hypothetical protein